jgi:hypothetical protein
MKKTRQSFVNIPVSVLLSIIRYAFLFKQLKRSVNRFALATSTLISRKVHYRFLFKSLLAAFMTAILSGLGITEHCSMMRIVQMVPITLGSNVASHDLSYFVSVF